jgi:phage tail protein X
VKPLPAEAASVTWVPPRKLALQVVGQLIPAGLLVTVPVPTPTTETFKVKVGITENEPLTEVGLLIVSTQVPPPLQPPVQPPNSEPLPGAAVKVTWVPFANTALQALGQLMPEGVLVTIPDPPPLSERVRAELGTAVKAAWIEVAAVTVTAQAARPLQPAPLQPAKVNPFAGEAVSVTWVFGENWVLQVLPQLIPDGELVTVPVPESVTDTS